VHELCLSGVPATRQDSWVDGAEIITVNCVDGPCHGLQQMDVTSQRIVGRLTGTLGPHVYRLSDHSTASYLDAYYYGKHDEVEPLATGAQ
jgi:hypothetical protein